MICVSKMYIHPLHLSGVSSYELSGIAGALGMENVTLVRRQNVRYLVVIVPGHVFAVQRDCICMYMRVEHENIESNGRTSASGLEEEDYHLRGQSLLTVVDDSLKYRQSSGATRHYWCYWNLTLKDNICRDIW